MKAKEKKKRKKKERSIFQNPPLPLLQLSHLTEAKHDSPHVTKREERYKAACLLHLVCTALAWISPMNDHAFVLQWFLNIEIAEMENQTDMELRRIQA